MEQSKSNTSLVPSNFGLVDKNSPGVPISNKQTILTEIDQKCQCQKPPALEYILVRPFSRITIPFLNWGICFNTFGHAAVRYTLPDGQQLVMNIEGKKDKSMVQFHDPEEFLYGTDPNLTGEQLATYNRSMISIRVHNLPDENILAMHNYFLELQKSCLEGKDKFYLVPLPYRDLLSKIYPHKTVKYGNCARWTSEGLKLAGVLDHKSYWPKAIWINLFENYQKTKIKARENMSVVSYRRIKHALHTYGNDLPSITQVAPLQTFRSISYFNLENFADCIVEVPENQINATVTINDHPKQPSNWRNLLNTKVMITMSSVLTGFVLARQTGLIQATRYLSRVVFKKKINRYNYQSHIQTAKNEAAEFRSNLKNRNKDP